MLSDYERKILRIVYNYKGQRRRMPTFNELMIKTGKSKSDVIAALEALTAASYLLWEDKSSPDNIVILEGWERESERPQTPSTPQKTGDIRYFTDY